jgi:hypothetical protein
MTTHQRNLQAGNLKICQSVSQSGSTVLLQCMLRIVHSWCCFSTVCGVVCCVQAVLDARPGTFDREKQLCDPFIQSGFDGVVAQNGETWKRHRRITSSAFR